VGLPAILVTPPRCACVTPMGRAVVRGRDSGDYAALARATPTARYSVSAPATSCACAGVFGPVASRTMSTPACTVATTESCFDSPLSIAVVRRIVRMRPIRIPSPGTTVTSVRIFVPHRRRSAWLAVRVKWDGKDKAGGWQDTFKLFEFVLRDVETDQITARWTCPIRVTVAVQSELEGYISPQRAALATADVANIAVPAVSHSRAEWKGLSALFCIQLKDQMTDVFRDKYKGYGARVNR
jgi:hypothetical protein